MINNAVELKPGKLYLVSLIFVIIILAMAIFDPSNSTIWIVGGILLIVTIILYIASTKKLVLSETGIIQETLGGKKELKWQDVNRIYIRYKRYGRGTKSSVTISIVFDRTNQKEFALLLDSYSGKKRQIIADAVLKYCKGIPTDTRIQQLANGDTKIDYQEAAVFS